MPNFNPKRLPINSRTSLCLYTSSCLFLWLFQNKHRTRMNTITQISRPIQKPKPTKTELNFINTFTATVSGCIRESAIFA